MFKELKDGGIAVGTEVILNGGSIQISSLIIGMMLGAYLYVVFTALLRRTK